MITSYDLRRYFLESFENRNLSSHRLSEDDYPAILFALDEIGLDIRSPAIHFPGIGRIKLDPHCRMDEVQNSDWAAIVRHERESWNVVFGQGNPYTLENHDGLLPEKNGAVIAVPFSLGEEFWAEYLLRELEKGEEITFPIDLGRNDPCLCGSGIKYKKCCLWR